MEAIEYHNSSLVLKTGRTEEGSVSWRSPSNLAIIKYWGKHGVQLPENPSVSFTLEHAFTATSIKYKTKTAGQDEGISLEFTFEGKPNKVFEEKIKIFLESLSGIFPFLRQLNLFIHSRNSFPHSSGIASSASSMSALALCLCSLEHHFFGTLPEAGAFRRKASFIARLGSGSACRSVYPIAALWGKSTEVPGSSDQYAIPFDSQVHEVFKSFHDDILIVSKGAKHVSSRAGHALMNENVYAESRYRQARQRLSAVLSALASGDLERFGQIAEAEALTLHALMMASTPPYILMKAHTITLIEKVRQFRQDMHMPLYFSLDAGPNLHLLYPDSISGIVREYIEQHLLPYCENGQWIADHVGRGPIER